MTNIENENVLRQKVIDALFEYEKFMDNKFIETANNMEENAKTTILKLGIILGDHRQFEDDIEDVMTAYQNERRDLYKKVKENTTTNEIGE